LAGVEHDVWSINEDRSFHEEAKGRVLDDRLTPSRVEGDDIDALLQAAFPYYDEVALGGAVGITATLGLGVATAVLLLGSNKGLVPMLSLLGNYLFGYEVSWPGLAVGVVEAGLLGFGLGWITGRLINLLTSVFERNLERKLATLTTFEAMEGGKR
jgi:hypothetical protein